MPSEKRCSDSDFIDIFEKHGAEKTASKLNVGVRRVYARREVIERRIGRQLVSPTANGNNTRVGASHPHRLQIEIKNGTAIIGSDAHIWPGPPTTAMRAFVQFCKELKPRAIILNGDVLDASTISRHSPIGWESRPKLIDEIEAAQDQLHEIEKVTPKGCERIWTLGNHDSRFETRIATVAPEFAKVAGVHLRDHFPCWSPCWSAWINNDVVVKHRFRSGVHAPWNNVINAGKSMVTGHLHSAKVTPFTDYSGTRWGVDGGCLADPEGKQFVDYTEDNPKNWRSAFAVLTFTGGKLLQPQLAIVHDENHVDFCGQLIKV